MSNLTYKSGMTDRCFEILGKNGYIWYSRPFPAFHICNLLICPPALILLLERSSSLSYCHGKRTIFWVCQCEISVSVMFDLMKSTLDKYIFDISICQVYCLEMPTEVFTPAKTTLSQTKRGKSLNILSGKMNLVPQQCIKSNTLQVIIMIMIIRKSVKTLFG